MNNTVVYSGYLDTNQNDRKLHYILVQAETDPDTAPLTIWLNGGPGCSSLIGFMQEIGPYTVGDSYTFGDNLTKNAYRWNRAANILFIESPGLVGFSSDTNAEVTYNDHQTADDAFAAITNFLWKVAPEFTNRALYVLIYHNKIDSWLKLRRQVHSRHCCAYH